MRQERAGSVQTEDQYLFAHLALMDFIKQQTIELINNEKSLECNDQNTSPSHDSFPQRLKTFSESSSLIPSLHSNGIDSKLRI